MTTYRVLSGLLRYECTTLAEAKAAYRQLPYAVLILCVWHARGRCTMEVLENNSPVEVLDAADDD